MKNKLNINFWLWALMIFSTLSLVSCDAGLSGGDDDDDDTPQEQFMGKREFGFYDQSSEIRVYEEYKDQIVVHSSGLIYRIQNDDQSNYWHVVFSSANLSVGSSQDIQIQTNVDSYSGTYSVEVVKANSKVWLWDADKEFGIIVPSDF